MENEKNEQRCGKTFWYTSQHVIDMEEKQGKDLQGIQKSKCWSIKWVKKNAYEQLNQAVLKWFTRIRSENVPASGILIKEKALYFAKELKLEKFQA